METGDTVKGIIALILGVGLSLLVLIFISSLSGTVFQTVESDISDIGNKFFNTSNTSLDQSNYKYFGVRNIHCNTINITNASNMYYYQLSNFTFDCGNGYIKIGSTVDASGVQKLNTSDFSVWFNYGNYTISNSISAGIVSGFTSLNTTTTYIPIIVLAVVIAFVLILVLGFGKREGGGGAAL